MLISIRADDDAADNEYEAFVRFSGLSHRTLHRLRLEQESSGDLDPAHYAGIMLGGGPFNASDPYESKSPAQIRAEKELAALLGTVIDEDSWFLGACYGIGTIGTAIGAVVDRRWPEPISAVPVALSDAGLADPLMGVLPPHFDAFVGHKEAISSLPPHAVLLASSPACPVQAFRVGNHVYATQFHPELDVEGLCTRITAYRHHGYFDPAEHDSLIAMARRSVVTDPPKLLPRFVELARAG